MIVIESKLTGFNSFIKRMTKAEGEVSKGINRNLKTIGIKIQRESRLNAKISPPKVSDRGGLEKSILWRVSGGKCYIFVPDNSLAGKYGYIQHDVVKGRGKGTIRKGSRAGWKFIDRAVDDNERWIKQTLGKSFARIKRS